MKSNRVLYGLLVLLPLVLTVALNPSPYPESIRQSNLKLQTITSADNPIPGLLNLLDFEPWRGDLWERLGRAHLYDRNYQAAVEAFSKAEHFSSLTIAGKISQADAYLQNGDHETARQLLRAFPQSQAGLFELMQVVALQRQLGDVYGAEATLLTAHQLEPDNTEVNFQLGLMLSTTQPESALRFLDAAEDLDGNDALLRNALITTIENTAEEPALEKYQMVGQVFSNFGEWDVAAQAFQSALANDTGSALSWIYLAEAKQQLGLDAFDEVSMALKLDGDNEIINGLAGLYFRRMGKYDLSMYYLKKAAQKNPNTNVWLIEQSRTQEEMGQLEAAYQLLIQAAEISPEDWATWKSLAVFSFTNNYEVETTGLGAARKALILNPSSPVLMDLLGAGLMLTGDYDSAERFFLQADEIDPHQSAILIHLGQLKVLQGKIAEARIILQQAVEYAPDDRLRDLALQLLNETAGK